MAKAPMRVAVTGAAGQICYSLLFRIANGDMLGKDQPVILQLLDITPALPAVQGVVMELEDCAFPLLAGVVISDDPNVAFKDADVAILVGARPRSKGMERKDLLEANGAIFTAQGKALNKVAADDVRIGVTGNPANTNALIAVNNAPDIPKERFSALTRLDHNRAISQLAAKTGAAVTDIKKVTIWGNHSASQYPDLFHAEVGGVRVYDDYAHHPTELRATLNTAKEMGYKRLIAVHQPFTYSRTKMLFNDFVDVLKIPDVAVITPIMGSREPNDPTITSAKLAAQIPGSVLVDSLEAAADWVKQNAREGDLVITLGCGDIYKASKMMVADNNK